MQYSVNKGDFEGALKELKGGGSAGNPVGSTPNAGGVGPIKND